MLAQNPLRLLCGLVHVGTEPTQSALWTSPCWHRTMAKTLEQTVGHGENITASADMLSVIYCNISLHKSMLDKFNNYSNS